MWPCNALSGTERKEKTNLQELFSATEKKCLQLTATNNSVTKERDHLTGMTNKELYCLLITALSFWYG